MLLYIACTNRTIHSSMPSFRMAHQMTFLGTRSNASRSTNAKYNFLFLARCFSCNCLSMNIASVVPRPGMKPNCMSSIEILSLMVRNHVIGKVSDQPCTSITRCLQHFRYYSRGTSSFASFHLGDSFHHHLNIYMYGRVNNRVSSQVLRIPRKFFIQKPLIVLFPSNFLGLLVKREVTRVIFDTFVTNHILVVFSQLFCNFEDVVHPRF